MIGTHSLEFGRVPKPNATWFMGYRPAPSIGFPRVMDEEWHRSHSFLAEWIFLHSGIHHRNFAELRSKAQGMVHTGGRVRTHVPLQTIRGNGNSGVMVVYSLVTLMELIFLARGPLSGTHR